MVDRHYSCVLVGGVASESRVLLARGTMAVLANWGQSGLLRRDPFPVSAKNYGRMLKGGKAYKK